MSTSEAVLGVDVGTTATKAVACDADGRALASAAQRYPLREPRPGHAEQDPAEVMEAALAAIGAAAASCTERGVRVVGLALGSAMHALLGLDAQGRARTPLLAWADTRATEQAARLRAEHGDLHDRTGTPLMALSPLAKVVWFRERAPDVFGAVRRWVGLKELVLERLTGAWAVDHSVASATGLLDIRRLHWDEQALDLGGLTAARLAPLVPVRQTMALCPSAARRVGVPAGTPVVVGAADGPLANLGVGAARPGVAACSIGTSGALRVTVDAPAIDPARRLFCYVQIEGRWVVGGAISNGGVVLRWAGEALAPDLGDRPEQALTAVAARAPAGSDGLIMLPFLLGERAPDVPPRGAYIGLKRAHRREHLVRAALEGVCQQLALVLGAIRAAGHEVHEVRATGGFARSALWRQILADALDMPVGFLAHPEGSALGAALLGMDALGVVAGVERAAELVRVEHAVEPDARAAATLAAQRPLIAAMSEALGAGRPADGP